MICDSEWFPPRQRALSRLLFTCQQFLFSGVYGDGIGEMAEMIGAEVGYVRFDWDESAADIDRIRTAATEFRPKLITLVHSETPCGTINSCDQVGQLAKEIGALFYVDFVSSGGGMRIDVDVRCTALRLVSLPDLAGVGLECRSWSLRNAKVLLHATRLRNSYSLRQGIESDRRGEVRHLELLVTAQFRVR